MILKYVGLRNLPEDHKESYPFNLELIKNFKGLELSSNIHFFAGDNGSGKSTLLESIAMAVGLPIAGSDPHDDPSLAGARLLGKYLSLQYEIKSSQGFFTRAEDFMGFARRIKREINELDQEMEEMKISFGEAGNLDKALGTIRSQKDSLIDKYGPDLEAISHGEGFIRFFDARITGKGLYLIDEPEAALSPLKQIYLIQLILNKVKTTDSQFIIATHSPLILGVPKAKITWFENNTISPVLYEDTQHYLITKSYVENRSRFFE